MTTSTDDSSPGRAPVGSPYLRLMRDRGFAPLMAAQFLGALNDNMLKIAIVLIGTSSAASLDPALLIPLTGAAFILPYLVFSGQAGQLADRFAKSRVLAWTKAPEILAMALAIPALLSGDPVAMLGVLSLSATQAAFFSPAKYGILPELLADGELSRGNALVETSTFLAIILGTMLGGLLYDRLAGELAAYGAILVAVACAGFVAILFIRRTQPPAAPRPFTLSPAADIGEGLAAILAERRLLLTVLGISWFWFLGALLQMTVIRLGRDELGLEGTGTGLLQAAIGVGIAAGSLAAGRLSGDKVEPGLMPLGSLGIGLSALWLAFGHSAGQAVAALGALGFCGGLYIVPLNAFLQQRADPARRGRIIAANNVLNTVGILLASGVALLTGSLLGWSPRTEVLAAGMATFGATAFLVFLLPDFLIRFLLWLITHTIYRIRIVGAENVPARGPALLVCNHISFADGLLVGACVQRLVRFMVWSGFFKPGPLGWLLGTMKAIPVGAAKDARAGIERARAELQAGHVVCIFAEGAISRTGNALPFRRGLELIARDLDVPVIPVHLDQIWGSIFSFKGGRFFWKLPDRLPRPVTVSFGTSLSRPTARQVRRAVLELGSHAWRHRPAAEDLLQARFVRTAKAHWRRPALADTTGRKAQFGEALIGAILIARRLRHEAPMLGILLPASVGGALANMGALLAGRVPVNLNPSAGWEGMQTAVRRCRIERAVTSRALLAKAKLEPPAEPIFIEDLLAQVSLGEKLAAWLAARLLPASLLLHRLGGRGLTPEAPATIMFSSGSTGEPKGVVLSHAAIIANLEAVTQVLWIDRADTMAGVLPFFHSFGFTGTLCLPLVAGIPVAYHPDPREAKAIGPLVATHRATILLGTPTFLRSWMRVTPAESFATLRAVVAGGEAMSSGLADAFEAKYGVRPLEGYGVTEMGPVISVNMPDIVHGETRQTGRKEGTVGHPMPGVVAKTVDAESFADLPEGDEGLLLVKGPGMMTAYLDDPVRTGAAIQGGWYVTGDIGVVDEDGFIRITDRLANFSKIAGEMVPRGRISDAMLTIPGVAAACVVSLPDEARGERLVALYAGDIAPEALAEALAATTLPRLWLPKPGAYLKLDALPLLGSGKIDLRQARKIAAERA